MTAALTGSETSAATDVALVAQNSLELVAEAQATGVASILGAAGTIAVNIVLGGTNAAIVGGNVKAVAGDVVVNAADTSTIDARARTTVDTASRDGQLGVTVPALGAAAAFNIVGYKLDGMGSSSIIPRIDPVRAGRRRHRRQARCAGEPRGGARHRAHSVRDPDPGGDRAHLRRGLQASGPPMTGEFALWVYLSHTPLLWLTVTLLAYAVADRLFQAAGRHPVANPVVHSIDPS